MIVLSSRVDRRIRLPLMAMALVSGAMVQETSEVTRLAEEARQAFLAAEQGY